QPHPGDVGVGDGDGHRASQPQRRADGHADDHGHDEQREQQRGGHRAVSVRSSSRRSLRANTCSARPAISALNTGNQIEYHHCGTPMPGEVSSYWYWSQTTGRLSTPMVMNNSATSNAPICASRRRRPLLPASAKNSMRMCASRTTADAPPTSASTIMRNVEISSVQANDTSVK